jgi:hypothetical protein
MKNHEEAQTEIAGVHVGHPAETLLIEQFRTWMTGHATCKMAYWDLAWDNLSKMMTPALAKQLFADFHCLTRLLHKGAHREVEWLPAQCRNICQDESLILVLVQASQCQEGFGEILAASELLGTHKVEMLITHSRSIASVFSTMRLYLRPIDRVTCLGGALSHSARQPLH